MGPIGLIAGVLVLSGWSGTEFSVRRRARLGRYVATHIESVLARAYDGLTGLPAWPAFEKRMVEAIAASPAEPPTVMYFDIDRLHVANDTLGRVVGDQVLAGFAAILAEELAQHATTRIAADHFAALLVDTSLEEARQLGERIAGRFRSLEFGQGDRSYRPSVSIGIASASDQSPMAADDDGALDGQRPGDGAGGLFGSQGSRSGPGGDLSVGRPVHRAAFRRHPAGWLHQPCD